MSKKIGCYFLVEIPPEPDQKKSMNILLGLVFYEIHFSSALTSRLLCYGYFGIQIIRQQALVFVSYDNKMKQYYITKR